MPRIARAVLVALLAVSCGGQPATIAPSASASAATSPSAAASPTLAPLPAGALSFRVADGSKAVIRVNEVVASVQVPGEAVVTTTAMDGAFVLLADGSFASGSKIRADLDRLKSDNDLRDEWIKINTLQTRLYRYAEFTPLRVSGVPLPVPPSGSWTAKIDGTMKIKTTERPVTWEVTITRDPAKVASTGTIVFKFGDYGMDVPANRLVLSVKDEVRLQVDLVATEAR